MKAVDYLKREHRRIEEMLTALDAVAAEVAASGRAPEFAADLLEFFRQFADAGHHAKEEALLFPALAAHGVGPDGIVEAMAHQHEMGRVHVSAMRTALGRLSRGDAAAREAFAASAQAYVELLRVHIQIEDDHLFPTADDLLTAEEQRALMHQFEAIDDAPDGRARQARFDALAARIHEPAGY